MKTTWIPHLCAVTLALSVGFGTPSTTFYQRTDLLSDGFVPTPHVHPALINPWGIAASPSGPFWIANEGSGGSSVLRGDGTRILRDVGLPETRDAHATGIVFNGGQAFTITNGVSSAPARFLFVTLDGKILGWNPAVDANDAVVARDNSSHGAVYTGLARSRHNGGEWLFAANFASGEVETYNTNFTQIDHFTDPSLPAGWGPFNVAQGQGRLFVTFAPRDPVTGKEVPGAGNGIVSVFTRDGVFVRRLVTGGDLDAPWGLALAPDGFGPLSHALLVGNFGDGRIHGYDPIDGTPLGAVEDESGRAIIIPGLWGLIFGNGAQGGDAGELYFTAGGASETHGVFGQIEFVH